MNMENVMFLVKYLFNEVENANSDTVITESTRTTNEACQSHKNVTALSTVGARKCHANKQFYCLSLSFTTWFMQKRLSAGISVGWDRYWRLSYGNRHLSQRIFADISSSAIAKSRQKKSIGTWSITSYMENEHRNQSFWVFKWNFKSSSSIRFLENNFFEEEISLHCWGTWAGFSGLHFSFF